MSYIQNGHFILFTLAATSHYRNWGVNMVAMLPKAEGVGLCLHGVTATDFVTPNKRYIFQLPQRDYKETLREECI